MLGVAVLSPMTCRVFSRGQLAVQHLTNAFEGWLEDLLDSICKDDNLRRARFVEVFCSTVKRFSKSSDGSFACTGFPAKKCHGAFSAGLAFQTSTQMSSSSVACLPRVVLYFELGFVGFDILQVQSRSCSCSIACSNCLQLILDHLVIGGIPMEEASDLSLCSIWCVKLLIVRLYLVQRDVKHVEIL